MSENLNQPAVVQEQAPTAYIEALTDSAFGKGLASAIVCWFPIGSIVGIVLGSKAKKDAEKAMAQAQQNNTGAPGKCIAGKVLGMIGKIAGIVMTVYWPVYILAAIIAAIAGAASYLI